VLDLNRSSLHYKRKERQKKRELQDSDLEDKIKIIINQEPTYGYRRIKVMLLSLFNLIVNRKRVRRILKKNNWQVKKRDKNAKPRVKVNRSSCTASNTRWAMDMTHIYCGENGWGHLTAVIDCSDREIIGYEFALRGRSKEAVRAIESACIERFGTIYPEGKIPILRSDNGLIFQSRDFRQACQNYGLEQEFITPYTPEQNGIIERFFRTLKEECIWQHLFKDFGEARVIIQKWIEWYNTGRPHQSLKYLSPKQYRKLVNKVA
jgi:putative transposase